LRPDEIAARHGVSLATVRKQLSAVLAKTGCARQADLLRLVLTLPSA
jgi:DNA-binding CsgD family transcriptional regulator